MSLTHIRNCVLRLSQVELAAICDVAQSSVSRWENGEDEPSRAHIARMLEYAKSKGITLAAEAFFPQTRVAGEPELTSIAIALQSIAASLERIASVVAVEQGGRGCHTADAGAKPAEGIRRRSRKASVR